MAGRQTTLPLPSRPSSRSRRPARSSTARAAPRRTALCTDEAPRQLTLLLSSPRPQLFVDEQARQSLERRLTSLLEQRILLSITDNRRTMISASRRNGLLRLRLHHMFLDAELPVVRSLSRYLLSGDRNASAVLGDYIDNNGHRIRSGRRRARLRTDGRHHDLLELFDAINDRWFDGSVHDVRVTWGRRSSSSRRRGRHSIRLGTYCAQDRIIRVHPALDQAWVPRFFVQYILFHEMLHHVVPAPVRNGRQCFHGAEFRLRERAYPDYERALRWETSHIHRLLTS